MMIRVVSVEYAQQYHLWLVGSHWPHLACPNNFQVIVLLLQVGVLRLQLEDHVLQLLSLFPIDLRGHLHWPFWNEVAEMAIGKLLAVRRDQRVLVFHERGPAVDPSWLLVLLRSHLPACWLVAPR